MKIWKKQIVCISMIFVLVIGMVPPLPVKASAATISAEASTEILMLLWELMLNGFVAGGAVDFVADYESNNLTFETFMDTLAHDIMGMPEPIDLGTVSLSDGTQISIADVVTGVEDGTISMPDVTLKGLNTWFIYDSLEHWSASQPPYNIDPGDSDPEEPKFNKIKSFVLGGGVFSALAATVSKLFNGEITGVDPFLYLPAEYGFTSYDDMLTADGKYHIFAEGTYTCRGNSIRYPDSYFQKTSFIGDCYPYTSLVGAVPVAVVYDGYIEFYWLHGGALYSFYSYNHASTSVHVEQFSLETGEKKKEDTRTLWRIGVGANCTYSTNVPVYSSAEDAKVGKNVLNPRKIRQGLDYVLMVDVIPDTFAPITGKRLPVSSMQELYKRMKNGYQTEVKPQLETETDTDKNTETYIDTMTDAAEETGNVTVPDPVPEPKPDPKPEPGTEEETTPEKTDIDIKDYEVDLKEIFPFCIPFDFIALLDALDAEPVAPRFEVPFVVPALEIDERYYFDLSIFDDEMALLRKFETVGFVLLLMYLTYKMIKW